MDFVSYIYDFKKKGFLFCVKDLFGVIRLLMRMYFLICLTGHSRKIHLLLKQYTFTLSSFLFFAWIVVEGSYEREEWEGLTYELEHMYSRSRKNKMITHLLYHSWL